MNGLIHLQICYSTKQAAETATIQIVESHKEYRKNITGKLKKDRITRIPPDRSYTNLDGGIPLPVTFVKEVSSAINEHGVYSYDLMS